jgi:ubiquinone/menaquinone biosynthesis C-methylase UbiE
MTVVQFRAGGVPGYDQLVGELTRRLIPTVIQAARLKAGHHVLDIACGTGLAFEAASAVVGRSGRITGADISPAMIDAARKRLGGLQNVVLAIEDAQKLSFSDASFDAAICNMGLMFFPNAAQGVAELHRVLRPGGWAAVSVNTSPMRSLIHRVLVAIDRHIQPSTARSGPATFDGSEQRLRSLFEAAGFRNVQTAMETQRIGFLSFDDYFSGVENGTGNVGQEYLTLPPDIRQAVREDVRSEIGDSGGPIEVDVDITFASGWRPLSSGPPGSTISR